MKKVFSLLLFLSIISCKKELTDVIVTGETENLKVKTLNLELQSFLSFERYEFDIDNNGTDDFKITHNSYGEGFFVTKTSISIEALHEKSFINVITYPDTSFLYLDSYSDPSVFPIYVRTDYHYRCYRTTAEDSVIKTGISNKVFPHLEQSAISRNSEWKTLTLDLLGEVYSRPKYGYTSGDTIYAAAHTFYDHRCHAIPMNQYVYIGLKTISDKGKERMGWIKLYVENDKKLFLLETAFQR